MPDQPALTLPYVQGGSRKNRSLWQRLDPHGGRGNPYKTNSRVQVSSVYKATFKDRILPTLKKKNRDRTRHWVTHRRYLHGINYVPRELQNRYYGHAPHGNPRRRRRTNGGDQ